MGLIGNNIGNYRVVRQIGAGGMGQVYLGVHPEIGARVAIKVITDQSGDSETVERFFAEARAVNLIRHERIVNVVDLVRLDDGRPAIIMEFLDGAPMDAVIRRMGALPLGSLARLMADVLDGLAATHGHGIVHRDLKPHNVFIQRSGGAKILDFGIAKFSQEQAAVMTTPGSVLGTVPYMSPEQARGDAVDGRSDVFAVGVLLYEGATGKRPFRGDTVYQLYVEHDNGPNPPTTVRPEIPAAFESVVLRALCADRDARFGSADAMKQALLAAADSLEEIQFAEFDLPDRSLNTELDDIAHADTSVEGVEVDVAEDLVPKTAATRSLRPSDTRPPADRRIERIVATALALVALGAFGTWYIKGRGQQQQPVKAGLSVDAAASDATARPPDSGPDAADAALDPSVPVARELPAPRGRLVDPVIKIGEVRRWAREAYDDAELLSFVATPVIPPGKVNLLRGRVTYLFGSASRRERDDRQCGIRITMDSRAVTVTPLPSNQCEDTTGPPRCDMESVLDRARQGGVELVDGARVSVTKAGWTVTSLSGAEVRFPDDCAG